ncbi:hypothetical protein BsWGS_09265 [Bradybaena similaris]
MSSMSRIIGMRLQSLTAASRRFSCSSKSLVGKLPVGFVGLGNMGGHMARNLLKKGYPVMVFDVSSDSVSCLQAEGATVAESPADVASHVTTLVSMLPASQHVLEVYTGSTGIFSTIQAGTLLIDCSTIDPSVAQQVAAQAQQHEAIFLDAPVSGGVNAARDACLTFMVGGCESGFNQAKVVLDNMGKNVVHCGAVGTGQAAKICNNMLLAISMIGTSEAMSLGIRLGLDSKLLARILNMSSGRCWSSEIYNPVPGVLEGVPASNGYQGGFGTSLMSKDLGLAQNAATATKCATPLGALAHHIYRLMCGHGYGSKDFSSAFQFLQEQDKQ